MDLGNLMQVLRAVYRFGCFEGYGRSVEAKPKQLESGNYTPLRRGLACEQSVKIAVL